MSERRKKAHSQTQELEQGYSYEQHRLSHVERDERNLTDAPMPITEITPTTMVNLACRANLPFTRAVLANDTPYISGRIVFRRAR